MASKSAQHEPEKAEVIEDALDVIDTTLDRVKVLYEQYFLGIQKQPPSHLHLDVERKLRDLSQIQVRNTALRYRLATLQQKFGSYNTYWRRTLRQIENGTYTRNLSKIGRQAAKTGEEVPEEILAAMPKRMREQIRRDREAALAIARRHNQTDFDDEELLTLAPEPAPVASAATRRSVLDPKTAYALDASDADPDYEAFFAGFEDDDDAPTPRPQAPPSPPSSTVPQPAMRAASLGMATRTPAPAPVVPASRRAGPIPVVTPDGSPPQASRPNVGQPGPGAPRPATGQPASGRPNSGQPGGAPPGDAMSDGLPRPTGGQPARQPGHAVGATTQLPRTGVLPVIPQPAGRSSTLAPSQVTRPVPIVAGSSTAHPPVPVETLSGPFPRMPGEGPARAQPQPVRPAARPAPVDASPAARAARPSAARSADPAAPPLRPPAGMTDADVNALYAKYVKAKEAVGEAAGPGAYGKLLKTINAQAPKIMEQYKAKGVDFSVVVKDNQVIIRAKPKV